MTMRQTASEIRALLESVYDTTLILDFRELCEHYLECFEAPIEIMFYIKERKWFIDSAPQKDDFLKFNYLSFEVRDGKINYFKSPKELEKREGELQEAGYKREVSEKCVMLLDPNMIKELDFTPIQNLTRRLFVAFYRNCGSFDHFRESVSLRFAREMHKSLDPINEESVTRFIQERLSIKTQIVHQKDELHFSEGAAFSDLVRDRVDMTSLPSQLLTDPEFLRSFRNSVLRKNKTYGKCINSNIRFAIVTHAEEYFVNNEIIGHRTIKQRPKLCVIFHSDGNHLDLEEVHHATRIISLFLHYSEIHDRENLLEFHGRRVLELEEQLSETPLESRVALEELVSEAYVDIFHYALKVSDAEGFILYEYDPQQNGLVSRFHLEDFNDDQSAQLQASPPHERVFEAGLPLDIWHPEKLKYDIDEALARATPEQIEKAEVSQRWLRDSLEVSSSASQGNRAAWVAPLIRGRTPIGVIEFFSTTASRLSPSIPVLKAASELAGEIMHRAELANDRGWLAKLSFIQVARHRLENAIAKVHRLSPEIAAQLKSSFIEEEEVGNRNSPNGVDPKQASEATKRYVLSRNLRVEIPESFWDRFTLLQKYEPLSESVSSAMADILETILSNDSHSPFQADALSVQIISEESRFPYIEIVYAPNDVNVPIERAQQLCISPLRRKGSPTYHYGLFLCGTQLRMIGGRAFASITPIGSSRSSKFALNFQVPLRIWSEEHGSDA